MAEDITSLQIQILYDKVEAADRKLAGLTKTGKAAEKGMKSQQGVAASLMGTIGKLAVAYLSVNRAVAGFKAIIQTTREFEILRAAVTTATGSVGNMEKAWGSLLKFANTTPYEIDEVVTAFTRMINYGLAPSERALKSFGNTGAAMQYSILEMTEAVAKATAGEFEPLRKFAITAKKNGDEVTFNFRGVSTTVKNTISEIQEYFMKLGEDNFGSAMADRMETLDGKFAMLSDAWKKFKYDLGTSTGIADAFGDVMLDLAGSLDKVSRYVTGGQLNKELDIAANGWGTLGGSIADFFAQTVRDMEELAKDADPEGKLFAGSWTEAFDTLPISLNAALKMAVAYLDWFVETGIAKANQFGHAFAVQVKTALTAADLTGAKMLAIGGNETVKQRLAEYEATAKMQLAAFANSKNNIDPAIQERLDLELDSIVEQYDAQKLKTQQLREQQALLGTISGLQSELASGEWDPSPMVLPDKPGSKPATPTIHDALSGYGKTSASDLNNLHVAVRSIETLENSLAKVNDQLLVEEIGTPRFKELAAEAERLQNSIDAARGKEPSGGSGASKSEMDKLEKQLTTEEDLISSSYANRLDIIKSHGEQGSVYQMQLQIAATQQFEQEQRARIEALHQQPERMREAFDLEEQLIRESYERRKEIILAATALTEEKRQELLEQAAQRQRQQEAERLSSYWSMQEETLGEAMGSLAEVAQAFGKKGFAAYKALAMAEAAIAAPQAALQAYLGGLKWSGGNVVVATTFAAIAASAVGVQIAKIAAQEYSGEYATGGFIPPGKTGLVGEAGPELVKGPAMVTSAQATWDRKGAGQASPGNNVEIKIINNTGESVQQNRRMEGNREMLEFIIGKTKEAVANDIRKGGTGVSRALEGTYNMGRGSRA